ncbi:MULTISPECIES: hypothetical protein [unclassified Flavobacterium]|jgi:hypothetical protein|uniref:hypothetical protein n=1 Tax=unclassified Flavobacterium TaxID=196869 RepID=UPI00057D5C1F|nr:MULTISPECIES: hypothetical protein [unclassified Flavobacterium]KIA99038.1 hypothetical protein OA93_07415 [Flavobacterium sp. KMS]KIC03978.1 hypothetical protein OA88_00595 [Flavobacterium sp. JRM]OUL63338.1 hypothetical protein B8T70_05445 [Flavobacterium sp. AJR]
MNNSRNKKDLLIGFIIGLMASLLGSFLFLTLLTDFDVSNGMESIRIIKNYGYLGKVITLGSILSLVAFGVFLKQNKEFRARGVVLAVIILALLTLLI